MKIRDIKLHALPDIPLRRPIAPAWSPGATWTTVNSSFVEVQTDEGITGYGSPVDEGLLRKAIAPLLIGQDPFAVERNVDVLRMAGGGWALEVALWDIIGKACGQPLYKLWGGYTDRVRAYSSCMEVRSGEQRAEDALARLEEGWRAIKLRIHDWTMTDDIRAGGEGAPGRGRPHGDHGRRQSGAAARARCSRGRGRSGTSSGPWTRRVSYSGSACAGWRSRWTATTGRT